MRIQKLFRRWPFRQACPEPEHIYSVLVCGDGCYEDRAELVDHLENCTRCYWVFDVLIQLWAHRDEAVERCRRAS